MLYQKYKVYTILELGKFFSYIVNTGIAVSFSENTITPQKQFSRKLSRVYKDNPDYSEVMSTNGLRDNRMNNLRSDRNNHRNDGKLAPI